MDKTKYIENKLKETIFQEDNQDEIISLIIEAIRLTNNREVIISEPNKLTWKTQIDKNLAKHLLFMYGKNRINKLLNAENFKFEKKWNEYIITHEYYQQILSYIVNSDDYVWGDRFVSNDSIANIRDSNYKKNVMDRWKVFKESSFMKQQYYSKIFIIAEQIYNIINKY